MWYFTIINPYRIYQVLSQTEDAGIWLMDEDIKKGLKKIARNTELKAAETLLRWRYKKEGKKVLDNQDFELQSQVITDQAHEIISRRGKNIWHELKKAYERGHKKE